LGDAARMRLSACSKGMLQRLALAAALLADPPLLLLDEPMAGLDPAGQKAMRDLIASLPPSGKTVLLSTHRLSEVAEICTHVAILRRGCLVRVGPLAEVLPPRPRVTITVDQITPELAAALAHQHPDIVIKGNVITLDDQAIAQKNAVIRGLLENGADLQDLRHERASLEEIYLEAMRG
jgi:ABC-2 type transport system ATP-binding protein